MVFRFRHLLECEDVVQSSEAMLPNVELRHATSYSLVSYVLKECKEQRSGRGVVLINVRVVYGLYEILYSIICPEVINPCLLFHHVFNV